MSILERLQSEPPTVELLIAAIAEIKRLTDAIEKHNNNCKCENGKIKI